MSEPPRKKMKIEEKSLKRKALGSLEPNALRVNKRGGKRSPRPGGPKNWHKTITKVNGVVRFGESAIGRGGTDKPAGMQCVRLTKDEIIKVIKKSTTRNLPANLEKLSRKELCDVAYALKNS
jgi:hypothetical protein